MNLEFSEYQQISGALQFALGAIQAIDLEGTRPGLKDVVARINAASETLEAVREADE